MGMTARRSLSVASIVKANTILRRRHVPYGHLKKKYKGSRQKRVFHTVRLSALCRLLSHLQLQLHMLALRGLLRNGLLSVRLLTSG